MSEIQYSEDGQWWWDAAAQQWQPVGAAADAAGDTSAAAAESSSAGDGADEAVGPLASMDAGEASDYFAQALEAGMSEVYEA